jgi:hypothetical protein
MTSKLFAFYVFAGMMEASYVRARGRSRGAAKEEFSDTPDVICMPCLRAPLECQWNIGPTTGALTACWIGPSANGGRGRLDASREPLSQEPEQSKFAQERPRGESVRRTGKPKSGNYSVTAWVKLAKFPSGSLNQAILHPL